MATALRTFVVTELENGRAVTRRSVGEMIKTELGLEYTEQNVGNILKRFGYSYKTLRTQSNKHNEESYVRLRDTYVRMLFANRAECDANIPSRPEVFLDESYVDVKMHPHHGFTFDNTPLKVNNTASGRACMVGAGVVYAQGDKVCAEWVPDTFQVWSAKDKAVGRDGLERDYHGNFNSELFEKWFTDLCVKVKGRFGESIFIMDGASYHKRCLNPAPCSNAKKAVVLEYIRALNSEAIDRGDPPIFDPVAKWKKAELLAFVAQHKPPKEYAVQKIAHAHGHRVLFTPPYHPELQPIETVWGALKNHLTTNKTWRNVATLVEAIKTAQSTQSNRVWPGARANVHRHEMRYISESNARRTSPIIPMRSRTPPSTPFARPSKRQRTLLN